MYVRSTTAATPATLTVIHRTRTEHHISRIPPTISGAGYSGGSGWGVEQAALDLPCESEERLFDTSAVLGRRFHEWNVVFLGQSLAG